jgi:hypothetical protein
MININDGSLSVAQLQAEPVPAGVSADGQERSTWDLGWPNYLTGEIVQTVGVRGDVVKFTDTSLPLFAIDRRKLEYKGHSGRLAETQESKV